jgi:hypothetical protein
MKLTIEEEKRIIVDAIRNQVIEYNEYPYIYSVIVFGFFDNNGNKLPINEIKKFYDKYEVAKTCKFIYNNLKEIFDITQIYSFIERHSPLLNDEGETIKEGRFHINLITTPIIDRIIEEPNRKLRRLMEMDNSFGIPIKNMLIGDIESIKLLLFDACIKKAEWVNKFQYSVKTQYLETKDDLERTIEYCLKDYINNKVDFTDILVPKASDFYKP